MDGLETVTVIRGATNNRAARETTSTHTVEGFFAWGQSGKSTGKFASYTTGMESATMSALLFVPHGADVQARDRLTRANGVEAYAVIGHALWAEENPLLDEDYDDDRMDVYQVVSTNG